jgi:hypothetical protein
MSEFTIRGYAGTKHKTLPARALTLITTHETESSAYVEIEAYRSRIERGEIGYVELIDNRPDGNLTNLKIYDHTEIPWSWLKRS